MSHHLGRGIFMRMDRWNAPSLRGSKGTSMRVLFGCAIRYRAENLPQHRALRLEARGPLSRKMWRERIEDV